MKVSIEMKINATIYMPICKRYTFSMICLLFLTSCAHIDFSTSDVKQALEGISKEVNSVSPDQFNAISPIIDPVKERVQNVFDIAVKDMPAKTFFSGLMQEMNENIVTHPDVSGEITLSLKDVTLQQVMDVLRDMYGYEYKLVNDIYSVYPKALRTEIFEVNYLDVVRQGATDSSVSMGSIASSGQQGGQGQQGLSGNGQQNNQNRGSGQANQNNDLGSGARVATTNKTDFWSDLEETLNLVVNTNEEGRRVTVNAQSGLVVITALPNEIDAVRKLLKRSEKNIQRQVIIEAKIIEVNLFKSFESGVNWSTIEGSYNYSATSSFERIASSVTESSSEIFSSILRVGDLTRLVSLLEKQGAVQVLSSPRVSTVNNQKALIRVGSDEFFVTGITNQVTTSAVATSTAPNIELTPFFSGISLDVTPQIGENNNVVLHVHPVVSTVSDQEKNIELGDESFSLPLALREIRESDSIVKARSGEIVVLGGLMQESSNKQRGERPLLADIPLLNVFFKTKNNLSKKSELIILLRPIVVSNDEFKDDINSSYKRISHF